MLGIAGMPPPAPPVAASPLGERSQAAVSSNVASADIQSAFVVVEGIAVLL
jgi:hypothetical protein